MPRASARSRRALGLSVLATSVMLACTSQSEPDPPGTSEPEPTTTTSPGASSTTEAGLGGSEPSTAMERLCHNLGQGIEVLWPDDPAAGATFDELRRSGVARYGSEADTALGCSFTAGDAASGSRHLSIVPDPTPVSDLQSACIPVEQTAGEVDMLAFCPSDGPAPVTIQDVVFFEADGTQMTLVMFDQQRGSVAQDVATATLAAVAGGG